MTNAGLLCVGLFLGFCIGLALACALVVSTQERMEEEKGDTGDGLDEMLQPDSPDCCPSCGSLDPALRRVIVRMGEVQGCDSAFHLRASRYRYQPYTPATNPRVIE